MTLGAVRGVPWPPLVTGSTVAALLMSCWVFWPQISVGASLFATGFAVLGATAGFALDEAAADAVDASPTTCRERTAVRAFSLALPVGLGLAAAAGLKVRAPATPVWGLALEIVGCVAVGLTTAAVLRWLGLRCPGDAAASGAGVILLIGVGEPFSRWFLVLPLEPYDFWARTVAFWLGVLLVCAAALVVATRDPLAGQSRTALAPTNWAL